MQGILLQYLMLGGDLVRAYDAFVLWLADKTHVAAPGLPWLLAVWALFCGVFSAAAALVAWRLQAPPAALQKLIDRERADHAHPGTAAHPASVTRRQHHRLCEFGRWQFWLPLLVVSVVLLASGRSWETVAWLALRFVAVGAVLLTAVSLLRPARWGEQLRRRGWWGPALAFSNALARRQGETPTTAGPPRH
jgi:hypothetical protein